MDGIAVNIVLPGRIRTARVDARDDAAAARAGAMPGSLVRVDGSGVRRP